MIKAVSDRMIYKLSIANEMRRLNDSIFSSNQIYIEKTRRKFSREHLLFIYSIEMFRLLCESYQWATSTLNLIKISIYIGEINRSKKEQ